MAPSWCPEPSKFANLPGLHPDSDVFEYLDTPKAGSYGGWATSRLARCFSKPPSCLYSDSEPGNGTEDFVVNFGAPPVNDYFRTFLGVRSTKNRPQCFSASSGSSGLPFQGSSKAAKKKTVVLVSLAHWSISRK